MAKTTEYSYTHSGNYDFVTIDYFDGGTFIKQVEYKYNEKKQLLSIKKTLNNKQYTTNYYYKSDGAIGKIVIEDVVNIEPTVITNISLNPQGVSFFRIGATEQILAVTTPAGGEIEWNTSDSNVATVSSTGLITAIGNGVCEITASCGSVSAVCSVAVSERV